MAVIGREFTLGRVAAPDPFYGSYRAPLPTDQRVGTGTVVPVYSQVGKSAVEVSPKLNSRLLREIVSDHTTAFPCRECGGTVCNSS